MRPYRAIPIDGKDFVYGGHAKAGGKSYIIEGKLDDDGVVWHYTEVIPKTIGQQVGLLDKNGKEGYEGDKFWLGEENYYEIVWLERMGCFALWPDKEGLQPIYGTDLSNTIKTNEIIGNIHTEEQSHD